MTHHKVKLFKQCKAELIKSKLGDHYDGINIKYLFNPHYSTRNIDYSLYLAKDEVIGEDFIYLEADIFFHPNILKIIVDSFFENCLIVDPNPKSDKVDTLVLGKSNKVTGLIFKDHGDLKNEIKEHAEVVGELVTLIKFNTEASRFLFNELEKSVFEGPTTLNRVFERCFQVKMMNYINASGHPWVEIDNYNDLKKARELFANGFRQLSSDYC